MYGILVYSLDEARHLSIWEFEKPLEEKRIALKAITGYQCDNAHYCLESLYGLFAFSINREGCVHGSFCHKELQKLFGKNVDIGKCYTIHLWNKNGCQCLMSTTFKVEDYSQPIPTVVMDEVLNAMQLYYKGNVNCSDCGEQTNADTKCRYFAGTYCGGCWNGFTGQYKDKGGWREVESKETYN